MSEGQKGNFVDHIENSGVKESETAIRAKVCAVCNKEVSSQLERCPNDGGELIPVMGDPLVGTTFAEKYEIISILGEGGMSVVYKARHKYMERIVAVKLLHEHLVGDPLAVQRFERESKAASSLSHQNIVTVHDFGMTKKGQAYFVMDCLEGESLGEVLERDVRLTLADAISIFKQTCDGLEHAHKKGIVHRDLKPSNLVLIKQDDGSVLVKIVDFGIAKVIPKDGQAKQQLTQTGEIFGSPLYMSPEQCNGSELDHRSDIYSLGCLMYETLAGVPPFIGDNFINTVVKHINEPPPEFTRTAPEAGIPEQVEATIFKCLAKDPADRYQNVAILRQSLMDAALEAGVKGFRPGAVPETTKRAFLAKTFERVKLTGDQRIVTTKRRIPLLLVASGIILPVLLFAVAFLAFWPGPEGDRGPNYVRLGWQIQMYLAQQALQQKDFEAARKNLESAKKNALLMDDHHKRLLDTLTLMADTYGKCGMFAEQEKTNDEIVTVNTEQVMEEVGRAQKLLETLRAKSNSSVDATLNQLQAEANADVILLCVRKLIARSLFTDAEKLLLQAISTFDHLNLANHQKIAEFKTMLAVCLELQQRLPEVRPLLVESLKIRKEGADMHNVRSLRPLVKAYLKLGQFDRDQSNFKESGEELKAALDLAREKMPKDFEIMYEALNSYGDYLRQTGKKAESEAIFEESKQLAAKRRM
jgi:tRNA A-37 threonylcarbamoyl transferase component Bud32